MQYVDHKRDDTRIRNIAFSSKVDRCVAHAARSGLTLAKADWNEVKPIIDQLRSTLVLASDASIQAVVSRNPYVLRMLQSSDTTQKPSGLVAYLPLNALGAEAIANGSFDGFCPDPEWIARVGEAPAAVYIWLVYMPSNFGRAIGAVAALFDEIASGGCSLFTRSISDHSQRLCKGIGFTDATQYFPSCRPGLTVIFPQRKIESSPTRKNIKTKIARTFEDMSQVISVRSATYIAEQCCHYSEEFDGNDFCATHIIGYVNGDPAGCVRLRFFASFAKIERLAVRPDYRGSRLAFVLARQAINHCQKKGYTKIYGHARLDLVSFWKMFGFVRRDKRPEFAFANIKYAELELDCEQLKEAISLMNDPMTLIRPEGDWDRPGPLDRSESENDPFRKSMISARMRTVFGQDVSK
ncbi:MAG: GNAT family N-acetyltransferase [Pseudomonadota bacterium]